MQEQQKKFVVIISVVIIASLGIGGWFFLSSKQRGTSSGQSQQENGVLVEKTTTPKSTKELSTIEKITARSFAEKVLKLLQNRDYGKVYDLLTKEDKATLNRDSYIRDAVNTLGGLPIKSWEIKEVLEDNNGASVQYLITYDSPQFSSESGFLTLVKESGKWYLSLGAEDIKNAIEKTIGDEVELATVKYRVNKVEEKQVLTKQYGEPTLAKENTKFIVIDMSITNTTKSAFPFPYSHEKVFTITDSQDRRFNSYDGVYSAVDNYLDGRELAPSIAERGILLFEIPQDAVSYSLITSKAGTNEVYKVLLK